MGQLKFLEIEGDLFRAPPGFSFGHTVAYDLGMWKGIAVQFVRRFGDRGRLAWQRDLIGSWPCVLALRNEDSFVYYVVDKQRSADKPTLENLRLSIIELRRSCIADGVKRLALPRIGCGIDGHNWEIVRGIIKEIFDQDEMEIRIYYRPA